MNRKVRVKHLERMKYFFVVVAIMLLNTSVSFAKETSGFTPKLGFSINSKEMITFSSDPSIEPTWLTNAAPVVSIEDNIYIPIRAFSETLGYDLKYDMQDKAIYLSYEDKVVPLFSLEKYEGLDKEMGYFSLNGTTYTNIENLALLEPCELVESENVFLLYKGPSPEDSLGQDALESRDEDSESTEEDFKSTEEDLKSTEENSESREEDFKSTEENSETTEEDSESSAWSEIFVIQDNQLLLTDEFIQMMKQTIGLFEEDHTETIKESNRDDFNKAYKKVVNPYVPYSYLQMMVDARKLEGFFPEYIRTSVAGKSVEGRDLLAIEFGNGPKNIYIFGSHHAREYISTTYIMTFIEKTAYAAKTGINTTKYDINNILNEVTYHIIPMVNPDGVNLVQNGIQSVSEKFSEKVKKMPILSGQQYGYKSWKSNINGVDLNRNYPVNWNIEGERERYKKPSSMNYVGPSAASEPEVQAVINYLDLYKPDAVISVHTQGKVIYWSNPENTLGPINKKIMSESGFTQERTEDDGYLSNYVRDVCKAYEITLELCKYIGPYPYPDSKFDEVWNPAKDVCLIVADEILKK